MRTRFVLAAAAVVIASCSSGGSDSGAPSTDPVTTDAGTPAADPVTTDAPEPEPTDPPATDPPSTDPPATDPPATDPPATDPPAEPEPPGLPDIYDGYVSEIYVDDAVWMCRGGKADDVCDRNLDATALFADGTLEARPHTPAVDPAIDCFYVYPTVSNDQAANSDLIPAEGDEIGTTLAQAARLTGECRVFAPVYRQVTIPALFDLVESDESSRTIAYDDVLDAFRHYIANDSDGRPFVLVGHSQGAGILQAIIEAEIDDEPALRDRMVSAILLGTSVPADGYDNIAPCATTGDTGCVFSYASFRATAPPTDGSFFGEYEGAPALCVNPVDPAGGAAVTTPYFSIVASDGNRNFVPLVDEGAALPQIETDWVTYPDMLTVQCIDDGTYGYLEIAITSDDGPRRDNIQGDLTPQWGMHLVDANIAMGNLVGLVGTQVEAYFG